MQGTRSPMFTVGWVVLLVVAGLMTLNHLFLTIFDPAEATLYLGWTLFCVYALLVIAIPLRRRRSWAWYATWLLPIGLVAAAISAPDVALYYSVTAVVAAVGLLLALRDALASARPEAAPAA